MKAHTDVPMVEFVERVVTHIYGGGLMDAQALPFFLVYFDGKPTYIVASRDAMAVELGFRKELLGQKVEKIKAVLCSEAPHADLLPVALMAIMSQLTQVATMLQATLAKGRIQLTH